MRPSIEVLRERHPLRVVYPFVGPRVLLFDHMEHRQHHVLVARDEALLARMFETTVSRQFGRKPVQFWKGTVVSAPADLIDRACIEVYEDRVESWWSMLAWNVEDYREKLGDLPGIQKCSSYKYKYADQYKDEDPSEIPGEEGDEGHYSCANCINGQSFPFDRYDFYEQHKDAFDEVEKPIRPRRAVEKIVKPYPLPNLSLPHDPEKPLYVVTCDGGHHQPGATIAPVQESSVKHSPTLFFQGEQHPIPEAIMAMHTNALAAYERVRAREEKQREGSIARRNVARFKVVERMFGVSPSRVDSKVLR